VVKAHQQLTSGLKSEATEQDSEADLKPKKKRIPKTKRDERVEKAKQMDE
jgi:hypothetical protein